jgi:uncharacterized membrane protein YhaH (DUF805 family)
MNWGWFLFGFSGRINRAKYWLWILLYIVAAVVVGGIVYAISDQDSPGMALLAGLLQLAFGVAVFVSSLAVITKRLHDRDKSAWWLLLFVLVPTVLLAVGMGAAIYGLLISGDPGDDVSQMGGLGAIASLLGFAILLWAFVELACLRGTVGPNKYGPDPLEEPT